MAEILLATEEGQDNIIYIYIHICAYRGGICAYNNNNIFYSSVYPPYNTGCSVVLNKLYFPF